MCEFWSGNAAAGGTEQRDGGHARRWVKVAEMGAAVLRLDKTKNGMAR